MKYIFYTILVTLFIISCSSGGGPLGDDFTELDSLNVDAVLFNDSLFVNDTINILDSIIKPSINCIDSTIYFVENQQNIIVDSNYLGLWKMTYQTWNENNFKCNQGVLTDFYSESGDINSSIFDSQLIYYQFKSNGTGFIYSNINVSYPYRVSFNYDVIGDYIIFDNSINDTTECNLEVYFNHYWTLNTINFNQLTTNFFSEQVCFESSIENSRHEIWFGDYILEKSSNLGLLEGYNWD